MPSAPLRPLDPEAFDYWKARHLLNRAGFGGTPRQVQGLAAMGLHGAVEYLLDDEAVQAPPVAAGDFDKDIMRPLTAEERRAVRRARRRSDEATLEAFRKRRQAAQRADRRQMAAIQQWWLDRMIETPRPLQEKMTLFWHGHFATSYRAIEDSYHMFVQNQLFRRHAVGNFKALVHDVIRDPAMLRYLDNNRNRKESPNENLARELMELFTLGEGNAYTEEDIKQGARALTGYTYVDDEFIGRSSRRYHQLQDDGPKRLFGRVGRWDGDDFVDLIFQQRAASEFICWKLYRFLVNDRAGPPEPSHRAFIEALAAELRRHRYGLRPVLRTLFLSEHFYDPANAGSLIKSPVQLIVQAVRTLRTPTRSLAALVGAAGLMGQELFHPPSVKGWEVGRAWINTSTLFVRHNTLIYLLTGRRPDAYGWRRDATPFDATHLIEHLPRAEGPAARDALAYLLRFNLAAPPHPQRVERLRRFVEDRGGRLGNPLLIAVLGLISAMPEYQLC